MADELIWRPNAGAQTEFLACSAYEALFGGAAGPGKSTALLMGALRHYDNPSYRALLLRRTFPELQRSLIEKSRLWYPVLGGTYNEQSKTWRFPSGAAIEFGHLEYDHSVHNYQSAEYQYLGWDELTTFTEKQYVYMLSRCRSTSGIPVRVRAATNPGGEGHDWVFARWQPWIDTSDSYKGIRAQPGQILRYDNQDSGERWRDTGSLSRVFFPAKVADNPHLALGDPGYIDRLSGLDAVTRAQLRDGDWLIRPAAGLYFKRQWFKFLDARPSAAIHRVRRWDLASIENGGDWTIGVLMARHADGQYVVEDVIRGQWRPSGVEATVKATAELDGHDVKIVMPEDPGQAGKAQSANYAVLLAGFNVRFERETGDKVTRAQPFSAQVEAGNVTLVRGRWNEPFMQCLEAFPDEGAHDDDVDAASGAFNALIHIPVAYGDPDWKHPSFTFGQRGLSASGDDD